MEVSLFEIQEIVSIFEENNWEMDNKNKNSLFNRYIKTFNKLKQDERDVFLKLTKKFKIIPLGLYQQNLVKLMENIFVKHLCGKQTVYIYTMKKSEHKRNVKSSDVLTYLTQGTFMSYSDVLATKKLIVINNLEELTKKSKQIITKNHIVVIIDDFIGSGKYAGEVYEEILSLGIPSGNIIVGTLFITHIGIKNLHNKHIKLEYIEKVDSCISELTETEIRILQNIENKLNINKDFKFGYGNTACLISLIRTPNNTLPVFWLQKSSPFFR